MFVVKLLLLKKFVGFFLYKFEFYIYIIFFVIFMKKISVWFKIIVYLFYWFRYND